ncbi:MAG: radical SAM protein [Pseudolabrys sp.]
MRTLYRLLKLNRIVRDPRLKLAGVALAHASGLRHLVVRLDPVVACNLRCTMCYFSNNEYVRTHKGIFSKEEITRIAALVFPRALMVVVGCGAEPTLYKDFPEIVRLAKQGGVPNVSMVTNGKILTERHIELLIDYGLDEIMISVHGTTQETYERFMVGASFETIHILRRVWRLRAQHLADQARHGFGWTVSRSDRHSRPRQVSLHCCGAWRESPRTRDHLFGERRRSGAYELPASSAVLQAVNRGISPELVWREDFDWRNETYEDYCRRVGWFRKLISAVIAGSNEIDAGDIGFGTYAGRYDVSF